MRVKCIYHFKRERAAWKCSVFPIFNQVYTVLDDVQKKNGGRWFVLAELENTICWHGGWWSKRFRPIAEQEMQSRKTELQYA